MNRLPPSTENLLDHLVEELLDELEHERREALLDETATLLEQGLLLHAKELQDFG